jgi:phospholipid/cholesterol/gamma-HCH transport system substrate-binding protein
MVSSLTAEIMPLKDEAIKLMGDLGKTLENVNMMLDSNARANIQGSLAHLNRTLANAASLSSTLKDVSPELKEMVKNLQVLSEGLCKSSADIEGSLANVNEITSQLSKAQLDKTVESLRNLSEKLQDPNGSIGKLLATDSLHNAVTGLLNDVDNLVKCITESPKKYIKVSVF